MKYLLIITYILCMGCQTYQVKNNIFPIGKKLELKKNVFLCKQKDYKYLLYKPEGVEKSFVFGKIKKGTIFEYQGTKSTYNINTGKENLNQLVIVSGVHKNIKNIDPGFLFSGISNEQENDYFRFVKKE